MTRSLSESLQYIFLLITCIVMQVLSKRIVTFRAMQICQRPLSSSTTIDEFRDWFRKSTTIDEVLHSNPGLSSIEKIGQNKYIGRLTPLQFPGLVVKAIVEFDCIFEKDTLEVKCVKDSMKQEYEGSKLFASWISKLMPKVVSTTQFKINEEARMFVNDASLEISFGLPGWFPIPADIIQDRGSAIIKASMQKDMETVVSRVIEAFESQESQRSIKVAHGETILKFPSASDS